MPAIERERAIEDFTKRQRTQIQTGHANLLGARVATFGTMHFTKDEEKTRRRSQVRNGSINRANCQWRRRPRRCGPGQFVEESGGLGAVGEREDAGGAASRGGRGGASGLFAGL